MCLHLQVLDHGGVLDVLALQVVFNHRQVLDGNSDIHRNSHFCHSPPDVNLKAKCSVLDVSHLLNVPFFSFVWIINDLGHVLHALEKGELSLILWNNTQHFISAREEPQRSEALAHVW